VLVVLAAATITAVLVQVAVNSAAAQKRRLSHDSAVSLAASVERRVANALSQDPLRVFSEVLPDEPPRVCSGDLAAYPAAFSAGSDWPASCGASWSYLGTGNLSRGARVFPPSPGSPVWRVEVFAQVGTERVGFTREFLAGGRGRPMLYSGGDLLDASLGVSFEVAGPVYAVGQVDLSAASVSDGVVVASEEAVLGSSGGLEAGPAGVDDGGVVVRDVFASPVPASTLVSSSGELARVGCLDVSPANVEGFSTGLCLRAGRTLVTSGGGSVVFPADDSYAAVLVVPVGDGQVRVYTRADLPVEWPGALAEWTEVGVFFLPSHGLVVTDATTVLGHCDEVAGVCRDWDGGGAPGTLVDLSFTLVVGTPDDPADLRFGGPVSAGEGRVGVLVSGSVRVPVGASPSGTGLEVDAWVAALGRPGEVVLASEGTGVRPTFDLNGALLLGEFTFDLSGFLVSSVSVPERSSVAPPFFPAPGLLFLPDRALRTGSSVLDALFAAGEASGFSLPSAPGLLSAVPGDGSVTLSWSAPLDDGGVTLLDYVVEYRESGASSWSTAADLVSTDLQASVSGLVNDTGYEFRVAAVNGVGQGPFSGTLTASPFVIPFAPTGLTVSAVPEVESRLDLAWNAVTNTPISGYNVYRLNQVSGLFELVASPATTSFSDSGLSAGTEYSYKVAAFTSTGEGVRSAAVSATTTNLSPLVPAISSSSRGNLTVTLSFSASATLERPVDGFRFYVDGVEVAASSDPSLTSYTFGGLTSGVASVFGVAAFNASGLSSLATVTVTAISTPNAPSDLVVAPETGVPGSLVLSWTAPTNETPDGFYVYRKNDVTDLYEVIATVTAPSHVDDALDVGVLYAYRVSAFVASLEGGLSGVVTATPIDVPLDAVVLGSTLGDLSVTLTFVVDETDGRPVDGYRLLLDGVEVADIPAPASEYEFTGLVDGFTYEFGVQGYNTAGDGVADLVMVTVYALPPAVVGLAVTPKLGSETSLDLVWDEPSEPVTGFYVYRENDTNGLFEVVATVAGAGYTDTGLLPDTSYTYRVSAYGAAGEGPLSTSVSGVTYVVSSAPTAFSVSAGVGEAFLSWSAPVSDGGYALTGYEIEHATSDSFASATVVTVGPSATATSITGLTTGVNYWFRIAATNPGGRSSFASTVSVMPLSTAPVLVVPTNATEELVYCLYVSECSGLSPAVSAAETFRFSFTADASSFYHVQAMVATTSSDADSWFGSSTELSATFSVSGAGSSVSGSTGQATVSTSSSGTVTVDAVGTALRDRPVFFKVTKVNAPVASGGSPTSSAAYTDVLAVYTTIQTTSLVAPGNGTVDFLVIGGGGSGGHGHSAAYGGSGGAGGYRTSAGTSGGGASAESKITLTSGTSYTVTVGAGGPAPTTSGGVRGSSGANSVFASITSTGGGAGSGTNSGATALSGGSGGGGSYATNPSGASGTSGQGYAGGNYNTGGQAGLGGGAGSAATLTTPGAGVASSITGASVTRAAGGSGAGATAPSANTGSGGSGGRPVASAGPVAASGGSGIVIVRYQS
jgi:fibronectin type 3 domain-containing protein